MRRPNELAPRVWPPPLAPLHAVNAYLLGDVASHRNPLALSAGLREPSQLITRDPAQNRRSIRKIAALRPRLVCFRHGPPLRDGERFERWAEALGAGETG